MIYLICVSPQQADWRRRFQTGYFILNFSWGVGRNYFFGTVKVCFKEIKLVVIWKVDGRKGRFKSGSPIRKL